MRVETKHGILGSGIAYQYRTKCPYEYILLRLDHSFLPQMMQLQDIILTDLSHPHMLQPFPEDFMRIHLGEKGFVMGVVADTRLIAYRNTYYPGRDEPIWNLGPDLHLPFRSWSHLVNLQFSCVHPDFRGNGLGYKMMQHSLQIIRTMENYHFCCATVSPLNFWSVNILLRNGFTIRDLKTKYGGKLRYLVCQNLRKTMETEPEITETVGLTDLDRQKELFARGFCGVQMRKIADIPPLTKEVLAKGYELVFTRQLLY